ncbi:glycoside hydrolase family 13 protein [Plicaturopsis crispa FD-325 SS-3]|nr:glycoside hydrolase family 13 protein [Plicaturopsis crispa FD-325 SS-3]
MSSTTVAKADPPAPRAWWKSAIVYQIYPISFSDSNGDGDGDLPGIAARLDYLRDLGADVLWLSPIYRSPLADMGYDISDYRSIDPRYGTLEDWDALLKGVHDRGMKLMMDLVVNHTSDKHEWFVQSRGGGKDKSKNPKRDWYIWRPPRYDANGTRRPPNNWKAVFGGSAWEYDEPSDEYYLHLYVPEQPDLNWENPDVREAVWDIMRFWINRGCDGFRMDVINLVSKNQDFPDAPIDDPKEEFQPGFQFFANGPRVHEFIKQMHNEVLSKHDLITVGETPFTHDASQLAAFVLPQNKELNTVFQFETMDIDAPKGRDHNPFAYRPWTVPELGAIVTRWQTFMREEGYWNAVFIENHDQARSVSRFGDDRTPESRSRSAKLLAIMQVSQSGTLYVYQGEELGMKNFPLSWGIEEYKDVATINHWEKERKEREAEAKGGKVDMSDVLEGCQKKARDHARTPVQWDATPNAGFTTGKPWMRVNDDYAEGWNAAAQVDDENSVWRFWQKALKARKENDVLVYGDFVQLNPDHEQVFAYTRSLGESSALVLLNFKDAEITYSIDAAASTKEKKFILGNYADVPEHIQHGTVTLRPYEGRLYLQ